MASTTVIVKGAPAAYFPLARVAATFCVMHDDEEWDDEDEGEAELELDEDDDLSPLVEAAIALHEIYLSLVDAGFQDHEALRVIANVIVEQGITE